MNGDVTIGQKPASILIVDDMAANLQVLTGMLDDRGYLTRPVTSGKMALLAAQNDPPDLVLLDITMPGMDGYEVCARMKANEKLKDIPVIFISALHETLDKVKGFGVGGLDYVTKPFQFEEVHARVETHLRLHALQIAIEAHNRRLSDLVQAQVREISESQMATSSLWQNWPSHAITIQVAPTSNVSRHYASFSPTTGRESARCRDHHPPVHRKYLPRSPAPRHRQSRTFSRTRSSSKKGNSLLRSSR